MAFRFRLPFAGEDVDRRKLETQDSPGKSVSESAPESASAGEEVSTKEEPAVQPHGEQESLNEFLLKNFLYQEPPPGEDLSVVPSNDAESIIESSQLRSVEESSPTENAAASQPEEAENVTQIPPAEVERLALKESDVPEAPEATASAAEESPAASEESAPIPAPEAEYPPLKPSDWAFEEKLASHKEWVESRGATGKRADLSCAELEEKELIGVNLRYADLHAANLKAADLLLTDLRDACLVRANLQESCLVGANLEGANLEGASMDTAMGLVPRQLAGATLRDASLPQQILQFDALGEFERASRVAMRFFTATISVSLISWLMIWKTKDVQLLSDSAIIPFLHSPAAATALPTDEIYLIAPVALFILYLVFQYHLQRLWDAVLELPAVFPDGRTLGEKAPRIVTGLLRAHFRWMNQDAPSTRVIEKVVSVLLGYWIAPAALVLFWARYLTLQEFHGTLLHVLLAATAIGVAVYATAKVGRHQERWILEGKGAGRFAARLRKISPISIAIGVCILLTLLSAGTIKGIPHDKGRAPQFATADFRRWAPTVFWSIGFDPYADLTEAAISTKPSDWTGADDQVSSVKGAYLNNRHIRYAQAYGAFLANSHLWRADLQGSFLSEADLRNADLGQSSLKYAVLDRAQMSHANLDRTDLDGANLTRVDLREGNLSYSSLVGANLVDARLDGSTLYGARLDSATMIRTILQKADLRNAFLGKANLDHADMQQAYLWSAQLPGARLENARLEGAIFIEANLHDADLRGAELSGTVLNGADLSGSDLDGADLRGSIGLTASQVCSAATRQGALLDDALVAQVSAQCGGGH